MTTSTDIVNQALQLMGGNQPPVTGLWPNFVVSAEGAAAARAANLLYGAAVATVTREFEWDFARRTVELELTGNVAPFPWALEYKYPASAVEVWIVTPPSLPDPFDPLPINFVVANNVVNSAQARVIHTDQAGAMAVVNNNPNENTWDSLFREAVVRLLASELAMAIGGKPDLSQSLLQSGAAFETIAEGRNN